MKILSLSLNTEGLIKLNHTIQTCLYNYIFGFANIARAAALNPLGPGKHEITYH